MPPSTSPLTIQLTLSGRPLPRAPVRFDAVDVTGATDERGHLDVELPSGRVVGRVEHDGGRMAFELVNVVGLKRIRVDLRLPETPLDDPVATAAMPSSRYVPLSLLGKGTAGRVYRCRDTSLDRLVAVKILQEDFAGLPENNEDFLTEARRLAQVRSPNLLEVYDVGVHGDQVFMVAEYVDGPNLEQLRISEASLEPVALAAAGVQLAQALVAIHEAGLVHRDIKPSNGLVDRRGVVKLADFGLVRPIVDLADPQSRVFGTPPFMSPEQLQGQPLGPAADLYSLGASLYDLATGHPPFHEGDLMLAVLLDPAPSLLQERPDCPEAMASLIESMLAKEPAARPTAIEIIDRLMPIAAEAAAGEDEPYVPRLSGSAFGIRWLAGPKTQRMDRLERDGDTAEADAEAAIDADREAEWDDVEAETQLMERPPVPAPEPGAEPGSAPAPELSSGLGPPVATSIAGDQRPTPMEFSVVTGSAPALPTSRDRLVSFLVGLASGLGLTALALSLLT